ncbi:acidic phospholipase A2 PA4-like [Dermacentor andersoni]|uniref:acidic phospholipase A2 PA4-like n=1 Tax=Dermacentor andersoni TaxID=34620 RepID=UPI00215592E6|nr:acidic phospholipase A2 PA4-like [Dermacentor andersoni]
MRRLLLLLAALAAAAHSVTVLDSWWPEQSALLRRASDGRRVLRAVLRDGRVAECERGDARELGRFLDEVAAHLRCRGSNATGPPCDYRLHQLRSLEWHRMRRACGRLQRRRRRRDLFLYPGTNWCGSGSSARRINELGANSRADRCCREHDHCPFTIEAFQRRFHLFNYRLHTLSHCECDERFRSCLKMTNNGASHMVGKLYFNVVQTKCFVFKYRHVCELRSWWGKCLKREKRKVAVLRAGVSY